PGRQTGRDGDAMGRRRIAHRFHGAINMVLSTCLIGSALRGAGTHHYASSMRTAVIRINVDPSGALSAADIELGMAKVTAGLDELGLSLVHADLVAQPAHRRELQFLAAGDDATALQQRAA